MHFVTYIINHMHAISNIHIQYRMRLNLCRTKLLQFSRFGTPSANSLNRECFQQVLQNRKKMDIVAFVLDRKYTYGQYFVRYQLVTKVSWYSVVKNQFIPSICENKIHKYCADLQSAKV